MECHYRTLGVEKDASDDEIRRAYKRLALLYHPDKNEGNDDAFKKISCAYQILGDPAKRREYDARQQGAGSIADILHKLISAVIKTVQATRAAAAAAGSPSASEQQPQPPPPTRVPLTVSIKDVYAGSIKKVVVRVRQQNHLLRSTVYVSLVDYKPCYVFEGRGDDGGDLVLDLQILEHPEIKIDALVCPYDLYLEKTITLFEYYYGIEVSFAHVSGETLCCKKKFSDGSMTTTFKGKGLPFIDESNGEKNMKRGDFYVFYKLSEPTHDSLNLKDPDLKRVLKKHFS